MEMNSLQDLYVEKLQDLYSAENQIIKALPKMIQRTSNQDLKRALQQHLEVTQQHAQRLEQLAQRMNKKAQGKMCKGMQGLLEEGDELLQKPGDPQVLDAGLIAAAQSVEHYEIAGYGTAGTWAQQLGDNASAQLLEQTLNEEKDADDKLTQIAENPVNVNVQRQGSMASGGRM